MNEWQIATVAVLTVCGYYAIAWLRAGKDPCHGAIVTLYEPPREFSPAMLRFVWTENFDDRTFWAGILSLVSKGVVTLERTDVATLVRPAAGAKPRPKLPKEEQVLLEWLQHSQRRKNSAVNMLDGDSAFAASQMASTLSLMAAGTWFRENRAYVFAGVLLSMVGLAASANPLNLEQCEALLLGFGVAAPGAFYLLFILQRLRDLLRAARRPFPAMVFVRALSLLVLLLSCLAGITLGGIVLGTVFGTHVLIAAVALLAVNITFLHLMKAPTLEGRKLLDEIEGFREFLCSVEKLPMDRPDAPGVQAGLYERYLPYAVALDVEQHWSDRFIAMTETDSGLDISPGMRSFYLGMWNGKPVEIVIGPPRGGRSY